MKEMALEVIDPELEGQQIIDGIKRFTPRPIASKPQLWFQRPMLNVIETIKEALRVCK